MRDLEQASELLTKMMVAGADEDHVNASRFYGELLALVVDCVLTNSRDTVAVAKLAKAAASHFLKTEGVQE